MSDYHIDVGHSLREHSDDDREFWGWRAEHGLRILGAERRRMGAEALRFEAVAREAARKVAEDFVHENTTLCARCDGDAYAHAIKDLTDLLVSHITADLSEGTRLWLAQREAGAP